MNAAFMQYARAGGVSAGISAITKACREHAGTRADRPGRGTTGRRRGRAGEPGVDAKPREPDLCKWSGWGASLAEPRGMEPPGEPCGAAGRAYRPAAGLTGCCLLMNRDRRCVMCRGADSSNAGEMLSPANAVQLYDEGDGDEEVCLELRTRPEPMTGLRQACAMDVSIRG